MASLTYTNTDYYLAGLFDGEGTIGVYHRPVNFDGQYRTRVVVAVAMCEEAPIRLFCERFGGRAVQDRVTCTGRQLWKWYRVGTSAKEALVVFSDLCRCKDAQSRLALEAINLIEATRFRNRRKRITPSEELRRQEIANEVKRLKGVV